jgi:hypothetical protein
MARKGPVTKDTSTLAIGLAQIRIGDSASFINVMHEALAVGYSMGAMASTKFVANTDWYRHESGFPLLEDYITPIREGAQIECTFEEITPTNMNIAYGKDPTDSPIVDLYTAHSGEVKLGGRTSPAYVRAEAIYTYPNGTDFMLVIFPRAQVSASVEMEWGREDAAGVPIVIEAKDSSSEVSGGSSIWDNKPLGRISWEAFVTP